MSEEFSPSQPSNSEIQANLEHEKKFFEYSRKIMLTMMLFVFLSSFGVANVEAVQSKEPSVDSSDFAAALATVNRRTEHGEGSQLSWEQMRGSGSLIRVDGQLRFLTVEHNVQVFDDMYIGEGMYAVPDRIEEWITVPSDVDSTTGLINSTESAPIVFSETDEQVNFDDDLESAVMLNVPAETVAIVESLGLVPFENVLSVTRESLDRNKYFYLLSSLHTQTPSAENTSLSNVWVVTLVPTTEDEYKQKLLDMYPWMEDGPNFDNTDFISDELLPFSVAEVDQELADFIDIDVNPDLEDLKKVAICQGMSGSVVVQSDRPLKEVSSVQELTVIGVLNGAAYVGNPIPILDSNENQFSCSSVEDVVTVAPISD